MSGPALRVQCGSAGLEHRQTITQSGEIQQHSGRRTTLGDHPEPPPATSKAVVKLDERAEPARVDEAHLSEIDNNGASTLAHRLPQRGTKPPMRLMSISPSGAMIVGSAADNATQGQCPDDTGTSVSDAERRPASKVAEVHGAVLAMKEMVRAIFAPGLTVEAVSELLDRLLARLSRSHLKQFVRLGRTIRNTARASSPPGG
jgi:hypothetical protein